jgi:hypothetical protein
MNDHDEHEWQVQENARRRARGNVSPDAADRRSTDDDLSEQSYDAVAHGLRMLSRDATPPDATSAAIAILQRAASDRRTRKHFERRVLGALFVAYVVALAAAAFVLAQDLVSARYGFYQQDLMWLAIVALLSVTGVHWRRR